jgi:excisionase family DNA binding protein
MSATTATSPAAVPPVTEGFATILQAAKFLHVGRSSIYAMMNAGSLPAKRLPGIRAVRIPWSALYALVSAAD